MGTMTAAALVCTAMCVVVATAPRRGAARLTLVVPGQRRRAWVARDEWRSQGSSGLTWSASAGPVKPEGRPRASGRTRIVAAVSLGAAGWLLVGGASGGIVAAGLATAAWSGLGRFAPRKQVRDRERVIVMLPLTADLLGEAIAAGCPPIAAVKITGQAIGGPLGRIMLDVAARSAVGADPDRAWAPLVAEPTTRPLVRALVAAIARGAAPGPALQRVASDARDAARWAGEARARSLGARAAAPLGLCFLPAFVLLGVVPIVAATGWLLP